jgi:hypothetical protein
MAHLRDGVVRNLPAAFAGATFHPPVAPARAVLDLQDEPDESRIARVPVLALARVAEGGRVIGRVSHGGNHLRRIVNTGGFGIGRRTRRRTALDHLGGQLSDVVRLYADEVSHGALR